MKKINTLFVLCCSLQLFAAGTCVAQMYTITDLGTIGGANSWAYGINASGQVTGYSSPVPGGTPHAFIYTNGTMTDLGTLGGANSSGQGINLSGQVAGYSQVRIGSDFFHAFLYTGGTMSDLGTLGGNNSLAYGINAAGEVTGISDIDSSGSIQQAFLYSGGRIIDLGTLGNDAFSGGTAINDSGQVTGWSSSGFRESAFLYSGGTMTDLGNLGSDSVGDAINASGHVTGLAGVGDGSLAHAFLYKDGVMTDLGTCPNLAKTSVGAGINAHDQVTGICASATPEQAAFLYTPGQGMVDLNTLLPPASGWKLIAGEAINDAGQIVGRGQNPNGELHAFLLSPASTKSTTATTLASSLNPSIYGQKVTLTARVSTSGPVPPTGTVVFKWKYFATTYTIGTATLNSAGVATVTKSKLNADLYPLTAVYSGDVKNLRSTSAIVNQVVTETTSAAKITSTPNPSMPGQAVTFTATITSPTVIPTGQVTFMVGTKVLGTAQLSSGRAKFTTSTLPVGLINVTAIYYGDSNIARSSASVIQTVQ